MNYEWKQDETELHCGEDSSRVIPVLQPVDQARKNRWQLTLDRYAADARTPATDGCSGIQVDSQRLIVLLDPVLNEHRGYVRSLLACKVKIAQSLSHAERLLKSREYTSSCVFTSPEMCTDALLYMLTTLDKRIRCGLLCARDLPGWTFLLAKQKFLEQLDQHRPRTGALVDVLAGVVTEWSPNRQEPIVYSTDKVTGEFLRREVDLLCIRAHGDSQHLNVQNVVCCGLTSGREHSRVGDLNDRCDADVKPRQCRRSGKKTSREIISLSEIAAYEIILLSCNGIATTADRTRSNVNLLLDGADGFMGRSVLCLGQPKISANFAKFAFYYVAEGRTVQELSHLYNSLYDYREGWQPFLYIGIPHSMPSQKHTPASSHRRSRCPSVHIVKLADVDPCETFESSRSRGVFEARSKEFLVRLTANQDEEKRSLVVGDVGDLEIHKGVVRELESRLRNARRYENSIVQKCGIDDAVVSSTLPDLARVRLAMEHRVYLLGDEIEKVTRVGLHKGEIRQAHEACSLAMIEWDRAMTKLLERLAEIGKAHVVARPFRHGILVDYALGCTHCGSAVLRWRAEQESHEQEFQWSECWRCGLLGSGRHGTSTIAIETPMFLIRGTNSRFQVSHNIGHDVLRHPAYVGNKANVIAVAVDQQRGTPFSVQSKQMSRCLVFSVETPADLTNTLHAVNVFLIRNMGVSHRRVRCGVQDHRDKN